jgi:hypothetical protein
MVIVVMVAMIAVVAIAGKYAAAQQDDRRCSKD